VIKNLLQRVFNFGQHEEKTKEKNNAKRDSSKVNQKKYETLTECRSLLRKAQSERDEKMGAEALITLEKIVEIIEREEL
jgi:hypothetical protein